VQLQLAARELADRAATLDQPAEERRSFSLPRRVLHTAAVLPCRRPVHRRLGTPLRVTIGRGQQRLHVLSGLFDG